MLSYRRKIPEKKIGPPPFFFRLLSNAFSDFGSVGRKRKKNKNKIGKGFWNWEALYLSITSVEPENNKVWLQSHPHGQWRKEKVDVVVKIKREQGKTKNL